MYVLLSVKPDSAEEIFNGNKQYEYRKTNFSQKHINKVIVYATSPLKSVIGEFEIETIICDTLDNLWEQTKGESGISKEVFLRYFGNQSIGYAIKIKSQKRYDKPYPLEHLTISVAPQSFRYLGV